jgi:transposase InsO family protein
VNSVETAKAFTKRAISWYAAYVEVVTDNNHKYKGQFSALLWQHGMEEAKIPPGQPSTNGMNECIVRVLKEALRKFIMSMGSFWWNE